jgi:3-methylcrotonyl-CoA carboxylase alpha subunit
MNTRLQVEHPVTEMITGLDLVEWQLRVASGERLPLQQSQLVIRGHAIEARVYAEDPDKGFLPSTGRLVHLAPPAASPNVRVDTGVEQGDEITPFYDPMIAKLIVWDDSRERALARMGEALAQYRIVGVSHNVAFLARLVATASFAQADLDTSLIEREHAALFPAQRPVPIEAWWLAALAELVREPTVPHDAVAPQSPFQVQDGWRLNHPASRRITLRLGEVVQDVLVEYAPARFRLSLQADGVTRSIAARAHFEGHGHLRAQLGERRVQATVVNVGERRTVFFEGHAHAFVAVDRLQVGGAGAEAHGGLTAPMPGKVIAWSQQLGATVEKGAPLLVLEAMKMEHTLLAPQAGVVKAYRFAPGEQVGDGAELVEFEATATGHITA